MGIISFVKYIASLSQSAGAVPIDTNIATHQRAEDANVVSVPKTTIQER